MSEEKKLIEALEYINSEYLKLLNSKEYKLGTRILKLKKKIRQGQFKDIIVSFHEAGRKKKADNKYKIPKTNRAQEMPVLTLESLDTYKNKKVAVYTCITGNYDNLLDPIYMTANYDYYVFSDIKLESSKWKTREIPDKVREISSNPTIMNRYIKMHPKELFPEYDYSIYVDGKVQIVSDLQALIGKTDNFYGIAMHQHKDRNDIYEEVKACIAYKKGNSNKLLQQTRRYKAEGMPEQFGMAEAAVIVSDLRNQNGTELLHLWWEEFIKSESMRDQISFPYVVWKQKKKMEDIGILGSNIENNPKFRIYGMHVK